MKTCSDFNVPMTKVQHASTDKYPSCKVPGLKAYECVRTACRQPVNKVKLFKICTYDTNFMPCTILHILMGKNKLIILITFALIIPK